MHFCDAMFEIGSGCGMCLMVEGLTSVPEYEIDWHGA